MCEFCHKHGEGEKWYLNTANYAEDLLSDLKRRRYIQAFFQNPRGMVASERLLRLLDRTPAFIRRVIGGSISARQKQRHFGQVVPREEVEKIFTFVNSIVRINCYCRQTTAPFARHDQRYCYGVSMGPNGGVMGELLSELDQSYLSGPNTAGLELLSREEATAALRAHEQAGMCHTVWTFHTPFIGGICNCDLEHCYGLRTTVKHKLQVMFRGEYVAVIDPKKCNGCKGCLGMCQFGAISFSAGSKPAINKRVCYGCGICRGVCVSGAITLQRIQS